MIEKSTPSTPVHSAANGHKWWPSSLAWCLAGGAGATIALTVGFFLGQSNVADKAWQLPIPIDASSSDSSDSMAIATGPISDDAEGIFFLDFNTGDLQCMVYYPRVGRFGAHYYTNVRAQLGSGGKNSKYLMVAGAIANRATAGGARPGSSLVYVTDVTSGMFAAYAIPWDRNAESTGRAQAGPLVFVQGGPIRNYQLAPPVAEPPKVVDPQKP